MAVKKFLFSDGNTRGIRAESERKINTQYQQATPLDCHALMGSGNLWHLLGEIP